MISNYSVKKPYTIFVAVILVIILGFISFTNMTTDLLPKMDLPYAIIMTTYIGASPEKVETVLTKPVEQSMATVSNIKNISSVSSENSSVVILEFSNDVNMDSALIEISGKLDLIKSAWKDSQIGAPVVSKINPNMMPIMISALDLKEMDNAQIKEYVNNKILPELERIEGVASVNATGLLQEDIKVNLNQDKIDAINKKILANVNSTLSTTQAKLAEAQNKLVQGKEQLAKQSDEQTSQLLDGLASIKAGSNKIETTQNQLVSKEEGLQFTKTTLTTTMEGMDSLLTRLSQEKAELVKLGSNLTQEQEKQLELLSNSITKTEQLKKETKVKLQEIAIGLNQITIGKQQLALQKTKLQEKEKQLEMAKVKLTTEISKASTSLASGETELNKGMQEFETARDTALKNASIDGVITQEMISNILVAQNFSMPAGYLENQNDKIMVKVGEEFQNIEEIKDLKILSFPMDGLENITLKDLANIEFTNNADEIYAKVNGNNGIIVTFQKQSTASTANVCTAIQEKMEQLQTNDEKIGFTTLMDQGVYIDMIINSVLENLIYGAILAVLILFIFLKDYKPTIIIALSIPISLTFAVALMYFTGVTINIISLSGLALGVGMLVDNSIVVIENIYRLRSQGNSIKESAIQGASRVAGAIAASTLTTVCVFLPIVFIQGISRQLFTDMGLTIAYSLIASLIVALTLVPAMASKMFKHTQPKEEKLFHKLVNGYEKTLAITLKRKAIVVIIIVLLLVGSLMLTGKMGTAFIPSVEGKQISITMTAPKEATLQELKNTSNTIIDRLLGISDIEKIGAVDSNMMSSLGSSGSNKSVSMYVILKEDTKMKNSNIEKEIYQLTQDLNCEVEVNTSNMDLSAMTASGLEIVIKGKELAALQKTANEVVDVIKGIEGIDEVDAGLGDTSKEMKIIVDKNKAMEYGLTVAQVYATISKQISNETEATKVILENKEYPVVVAKSETKKITEAKLKDITLSGKKNQEEVELKLSELATIEESNGLSSIGHDNQTRYVKVSASIKTDSNVGLVGREVEAKLKDYQEPEGYTVELQGESATINQSLKDLLTMIGVAVIFIYLIMVAQFQSLKSPFIVMFTIPLAFTGGIFALFFTGSEISLIAMLGFLMLAGIVVNNGIVFIDNVNILRKEKGMKVEDALLETGKTRLKPILMTALTTILGLSTMALGIGSGTEMIRPLAIVTIGGLLYATVLTLYLVPCLYMILNKDKKKEKKPKKEEK